MALPVGVGMAAGAIVAKQFGIFDAAANWTLDRVEDVYDSRPKEEKVVRMKGCTELNFFAYLSSPNLPDLRLTAASLAPSFSALAASAGGARLWAT